MVALSALAVSLLVAAPGQPVLLDFNAAWCGPCRQMQPVVHDLTAAGYAIRPIDIDQHPELASQYRVTGVPCFIMTVDGREIERVSGAVSRDRIEQMFARIAKPAPSAEHVSLAARRSPETDGLVDRLVASSIRLRINDDGGSSVGSGTIIDAREGEALIVTCGHVFRESKGQGRVEVDLLAPGAPQGLPARLVGYDLKSDVGFLSIRPGVPVTPAKIASADWHPARDEPVISIGCDHGKAPSARLTRVTSTNKYLGPANLQIAGQPVQGRSGGGLFSSEGLLIGVCNAADPQDNEGLFAALPTIHAELMRLGLEELIASPALAVAPQSATDAKVAERDAVELTSSERALLDQLRAKTAGAEVICIVRPLDNPQAKSEIIVLDRASPQFLERLSAESRRQPANNLTSARAAN